MPERQCKGCKRQKEWGCEAKKIREFDPKTMWDEKDCWTNPSTLPLTLDGEITYACPRQTLREHPRAWNRLLKFYRFYQKGYLPEEGAVIDQSNKLIEVFGILDSVNAECDNEKTPTKAPPQLTRPSMPPRR